MNNHHEITFICIASTICILFLFIYINNNHKSYIENLENKENPNAKYEDYSKQEQTSYMLAQKNSANITFLKEEYDEVQKLKDKLEKIQQDVNRNSQGLTSIIEQQQKYANSVDNASNEEMQ
jgi:hypothetical protein